MIEIECFPELKFKFTDNGDMGIIRMNLEIFEVPSENPGYFKSN